MLREKASDDPGALGEIEAWGRLRERGLPVLRKLVALLGRHGTVGRDTHRAARNFVVKQCFAIAKDHGLDQMDYRYRDGESGPQASLMTIGLHAVELDGSAPTDGLFPDAASERAFLAAIAGKGRAGPGRMARDAIVPERERMAPPRGHGRG